LFLSVRETSNTITFIISKRPNNILVEKIYFAASGKVEKFPIDPIVFPNPGPIVPKVATDPEKDVIRSISMADNARVEIRRMTK
jgi:hypothetical protein